jgi:alanine dehydrogenase
MPPFLTLGQQVIMQWDFETITNRSCIEPATGVADKIEGNFETAPGVVGKGLRLAGNNVTHPWTLLIADKGVAGDCKVRKELLGGINTMAGIHTCLPVAKAHGLAYLQAAELLE